MKRALAALLVVLALSVAATQAPAAGADRHCWGGVLHAVGDRTVAYAAEVHGRTATYRRPRGERLAVFPRLDRHGYPTTFWIVGVILNSRCDASWYRIKVPLRPNGRVGYVRPTDVAVVRVATRIAVDLSRRALSFYRRGKLVLTTPVAVGSPATPTPIGRYYVSQRLVVTDADGPYGPAALGISAFSTVPTGWQRGRQIAIHGTSAPWSIGRAVSNGCVRVPNATLTRLFAATPAGTPVVIHP